LKSSPLWPTPSLCGAPRARNIDAEHALHKTATDAISFASELSWVQLSMRVGRSGAHCRARALNGFTIPQSCRPVTRRELVIWDIRGSGIRTVLPISMYRRLTEVARSTSRVVQPLPIGRLQVLAPRRHGRQSVRRPIRTPPSKPCVRADDPLRSRAATRKPRERLFVARSDAGMSGCDLTAICSQRLGIDCARFRVRP